MKAQDGQGDIEVLSINAKVTVPIVQPRPARRVN